ncbi:hypothetical protein HDZ31DRAFT_61727 [Schizophyllum fasciatum]
MKDPPGSEPELIDLDESVEQPPPSFSRPPKPLTREALVNSIHAELYHGRVYTYAAAVFPSYVLYTLAKGGMGSLTIRGITANVSGYAFVPAFISSWVETRARCANESSGEKMAAAAQQLRQDQRELTDDWFLGMKLGFALGLFKKVTLDPGLPVAGALRTARECASRASVILCIGVYVGGSLGAIYHFSKLGAHKIGYYRQAGLAVAQQDLLAKVRLTEDRRAWLREYGFVQLSVGARVATTFALLAIPATALNVADKLTSNPPVLGILARRVFFWAGYGLFLMSIPTVHSLVKGQSLDDLVRQRIAVCKDDSHRSWNKHMLYGSAVGAVAAPLLARRAPSMFATRASPPLGGILVHGGRRQAIRKLAGAGMLLGGGIGSLAFLRK